MTARFVWWDLNTKNKDAALPFYTALFGWATQAWTPDGAPEGTPPYTMLCIGEKSFGGVNQLPPENPAPSHWMGHIQVDDVDAAKGRAEAMGAKFPMGVMEVPTVGRMAIMMDNEGCVVSLFQPQGEMTDRIPGDTPGAVGWNECGVEDVDKAKAFYSEVVGWKWRMGPNPEIMEYHLFGSGEQGGEAGGMYKRPPEMPVSAWMLYFTVKDLDATIAKVKELGGTPIHEPIDVPDTGRMAFATAPDGSVFGFAQWAF